VHSRYRRSLADAPVAGQRVVIRLEVRRFFCDNEECSARTFVERPGVTVPHGRRTSLLTGMLAVIAVALAGRAGSRLGRRLGMATGKDTLLRLLRALADPEVGQVSVLGVDDFALRRGHVYATVLVDMATHRPIDLLGDRESDTFADWLRAHPGIEVICRDRAGAYAEGARLGAPPATQVADRWHLWHNLAGHVERTVLAHRCCLRELAHPDLGDQAAGHELTEEALDPGSSPDDGGGELIAPVQELTIVTRTHERYEAVSRLRETGESISAISRILGLDRRTVRRFVRATGLAELQAKTLQRASLVDGFADYLHRRWTEGATDAAALTKEITTLGYRGSEQTVRRYLRPLRDGRPVPPARPASPTVREVTGWMLRHPDNLKPDEQIRFKQVLAHCPQLEAAATHTASFAEMMCQRRGERLEEWIYAVEADELPELHRFTTGIRRDHAAVLAGLTQAHNSGPVEGTVNKIKMLKRQMFGRANFDLLRKRVLLAT
jgi:transposase